MIKESFHADTDALPWAVWIGVQKGPRDVGDRRLKGTRISMDS